MDFEICVASKIDEVGEFLPPRDPGLEDEGVAFEARRGAGPYRRSVQNRRASDRGMGGNRGVGYRVIFDERRTEWYARTTVRLQGTGCALHEGDL